ncbi:universal stress protein [Streptomyces sp. NPDC058595]|uniref:universal stress protein n=1 Tax=Streptomyces sp. NPDC058595 TaxID=3346550 RepID=UPI0036480CD7
MGRARTAPIPRRSRLSSPSAAYRACRAPAPTDRRTYCHVACSGHSVHAGKGQPRQGALQEVSTMTSTVTAGIDGSPESLAAAHWAADEAGHRRLPLKLLNVWESVPGAGARDGGRDPAALGGTRPPGCRSATAQEPS